ncbi:helix-turn-helix domain-containing protein [Rhodococcus oxybenzonivorans]|uniref:PucR family transcriptional regulator n=1 Tax=Rhodococcus oxybenzonivorans TaxID=1990687 RepID=UPI0029553E4E|nr:helix-turn-helix domain-containing protein [Rhodococcus oxybenzonivorans]MDV7355056.1 helix-turn-helix domain-containing protein [Rhodococcus oxybenzonivorans]
MTTSFGGISRGGNILRPVALEMGHRMEAFVADLMTSARSELPELTEDERMAALLEASIVEDVIAVIEFLDDAVGEADIQLPLPVRSFLRVLAQRDVSITVVIRAYRMAQTDFLDQAMSFALTLGPEASPQAIIALVNRTALWIDRMLEQVGEVYEAERDRWVSSRSGLHRQWVETLLTGAGAEVHHAEQALGYRLDTVHLAVAAWLDESVATRDALTLFDETRSLLAKYVGATGHPLMVPTDEHEVRLWIPLRGNEPFDVEAMEAALAEHGLGVRLALGDPGRGENGFRRSHLQATRAQRVALACAGRRRVVAYAQITPLALMTDDIDALRWFVRRTLGDLAADGERDCWLRETLLTFLSCGRSYTAAADAMHLHRNTIQYRLQQAAERLGHDFEDPAIVLDIQLALQACRWLGSTVLSRPEDN